MAHVQALFFRAGFERLGLGLTRLQEFSASPVLTVTLNPAFAAKWLLPRIEDFHAMQPEIDLRLETTPRVLDFAAQGVDIGIRYGAGGWADLAAEKLLDERIYPVCSSAFSRPSTCLRRWPITSSIGRKAPVPPSLRPSGRGFWPRRRGLAWAKMKTGGCGDHLRNLRK